MARAYTVSFENVAVAAAQDLFELIPADDKPIQIMGYEFDNVGGVADAGDAQEELLRCSLISNFTTTGSGGSTPTPAAVISSDSASGFTAKANNTTLAVTGTTRTLWNFGVNVRAPGPIFLPPECWFTFSQADTRIVVRLVAAPADSIQMSGTIWVNELG